MLNQNFIADSAAEVGIDQDLVDALLLRVQQEVDAGLLPSAQVALARHGKIVAFETFGDTPANPLYCIFSATKGITSAAAWLLIQEGKLNTDAKVVDYVPEFGNNGKDAITVEQLFTHTAGFPHAPFRPTLWNDHAERLKRFSDWTLNWEPGSRFEYHPTSSMWIIAEIIERISGLDFDKFIRSRIAEPLGLDDLWVGTPTEQHGRIAEVTHVGEAMTSQDYASLGITEPPETEVTEDALTSFNKPEIRQVPIPGGGGIMSAAEIALFYQALMTGKNFEGETLWQQSTLTHALQVRTGKLIDMLGGHSVNRALGTVIAGDEKRNLRGFGHTNSALAFGHGGAGGQLAWADPATGISLGYCTNGHDRHAIRQGRRGISISNKAAVCAL
ncbi:MAG: serine hydrolase [Pseudomonadales bacterium]|nr:serine hydrolase [Pseudomonadales bacterium]MDG1441315.1 serine hydrolase [Pseudomonadales bacterium]